MKNYIAWVIPTALFIACNGTPELVHDHGEDGHDHGNELSIDTTIWTSSVELFVEYPVLILGTTSRFAAHFTRLVEHIPVEEGSVTVSLIKGDKGIRQTVDGPSSPGIFMPAIQPVEVGTHQLIIELSGGGLNERFELGQVEVYPTETSASEALALDDHPEPEISFLKEQAWKIDFQTIQAVTDTIYGIVRVAGQWIPSPGTQQTLSAGTAGNVLYAIPGIVEGLPVKKGQVLMRISGKDINTNSIEASIRKAKAEFERAESEYQRKQALHELEIIPVAELEEVRERFEVAQATYQQLLTNYGTNGVSIRAPYDGYVKYVSIENGAFSEVGQPLLTIGSGRTSLIKASVAPSARDHIFQTKKVWIIENGTSVPLGGTVVSVGRNVSVENPMVPVFIEVNTPVSAIEGSLAEIQLGYSNYEQGVLIPKQALLENFGTYQVIVQTGGEAFEMRTVKTGATNGNRVVILEGLQAGEWIVTTGAYQVKMASMSGAAPAHGHAH